MSSSAKDAVRKKAMYGVEDEDEHCGRRGREHLVLDRHTVDEVGPVKAGVVSDG
jgi:hypothetical protein